MGQQTRQIPIAVIKMPASTELANLSLTTFIIFKRSSKYSAKGEFALSQEGK